MPRSGSNFSGWFQMRQEHLLHDLLGERGVDQQALGQGEHGPGVATVGLGEGVLAIAADGDDEDRVAALGEVFGDGHGCPWFGAGAGPG